MTTALMRVHSQLHRHSVLHMLSRALHADDGAEPCSATSHSPCGSSAWCGCYSRLLHGQLQGTSAASHSSRVLHVHGRVPMAQAVLDCAADGSRRSMAVCLVSRQVCDWRSEPCKHVKTVHVSPCTDGGMHRLDACTGVQAYAPVQNTASSFVTG